MRDTSKAVYLCDIPASIMGSAIIQPVNKLRNPSLPYALSTAMKPRYYAKTSFYSEITSCIYLYASSIRIVQ